MKIAICNEDLAFADILKSKIFKYLFAKDIDTEIFVFKYTQVFLKSNFASYDIVFFDIDIKDTQHFDIYNKFREHNKIAFIVFLCGFLPKSCDLDDAIFIIKGSLTKELKSCIDDILEKTFLPSNKFRFFCAQNSFTSVAYSDILFFESISHTVCLHLLDKSFTFKESLANIEDVLPCSEFIRIQRSYIINLQYIVKTNYCTITLKDNSKLICNRQKRAEIVERAYEWHMRH